MTVKELIAILETFPQDVPVIAYRNDESFGDIEPNNVYVEETGKYLPDYRVNKTFPCVVIGN